MNPYQKLDERNFWAPSIAQRNMFDIEDLWRPKFRIDKSSNIVTFGSCFAQHFGQALRARGFRWRETEPAPEGLSEEKARKYNYGVFSARTGNIYTVSLLQQWIDWALGVASPPDEIWKNDDRYFDPFRPAIEPNGFASKQELIASREMTIDAMRNAILQPRCVFVFTLGLTERWYNKTSNYEYPMCPGTVAGNYDAKAHAFDNLTAERVTNLLRSVVEKLHSANRRLRILLTVSPVPLTATYSDKHVLAATTYSKSVLRAAAGDVADAFKYVDYFPSYEVISGFPFKGLFFEPNLRSVNHRGVAHVMQLFFEGLEERFPDAFESGGDLKVDRYVNELSENAADLICEEELLDAFGTEENHESMYRR